MPARLPDVSDRPMPGLPRPPSWCPPLCRIRSVRLQQEMELRRALCTDEDLDVRHNREIDTIYKLDAVVLDRTNPLLPAVGIQFTTKHDPDKQRRTIAAIRRSCGVPRFLYLEAECPLKASAYPVVQSLVRHTAQMPVDRGVGSAILASDGNEGYCLRQVKNCPIETESNVMSQVRSP